MSHSIIYGGFDWACTSLCIYGPSSNPERDRAMAVVLKTCNSILVRKGTHQDVVWDVSMSFLEYLLGQRVLRMKKLDALCGVVRALAHHPKTQSDWERAEVRLVEEVHRWGRCGFDWVEVAGVLSKFHLEGEQYLDAWGEGRVKAANGYWRSWAKYRKLPYLLSDVLQPTPTVYVDEVEHHVTLDMSPARDENGKRVHRTPVDEEMGWMPTNAWQPEYQLELHSLERFECALAELKTSGWVESYLARCVTREALQGWRTAMTAYCQGLLRRLDDKEAGVPSVRMRNGRQMLWQRIFESVESSGLSGAPMRLRALTRETRARLNAEEARIQAERVRLSQEKGPNWSRKKKNLGEQLKTLKWKVIREMWGHPMTMDADIRAWCADLDNALKKQVMLCALIRETRLFD